MTDAEWVELRSAIHVFLPKFIDSLCTLYPQMSLLETQICILVKLKFSPTELCILLGKSSSAIANARKRLLEKIFKTEGSPTEFDQKIRFFQSETHP